MFSDFTREKKKFSRKWWGAGANLTPPPPTLAFSTVLLSQEQNKNK